MRPDLKAAEDLLDALAERFPDARDDVESVRTQMGLRRRTAESHSPEITDRLARDSDKKPAPSASEPSKQDTRRGDVSAEYGIEEPASSDRGEFGYSTKPPFYDEAKGRDFPPVPTVTLEKLASLLQVSPEEVAANLRYMNLRSGPMGRPYPRSGDTLSLRTAYALHLQLNGNSAAHLGAPVELSTSGHYDGPVLAFIESPAFPKLAKLFMSQPYYDIRDALLPLIKEKGVEMTKDVRRRAESLAMELRHFGNVPETEEG